MSEGPIPHQAERRRSAPQGWRGRQGKAEGGALPRRTGHRELPPVQLQQSAANGQAQPRAAYLPDHGMLGAEELGEELPSFPGREADPGVLDGNAYASL